MRKAVRRDDLDVILIAHDCRGSHLPGWVSETLMDYRQRGSPVDRARSIGSLTVNERMLKITPSAPGES
jgi:hypothetical protein